MKIYHMAQLDNLMKRHLVFFGSSSGSGSFSMYNRKSCAAAVNEKSKDDWEILVRF